MTSKPAKEEKILRAERAGIWGIESFRKKNPPHHRRGESGLPLQVGALPWRHGATGLEVLLVQSLSTGRWIVPKGWPMRDLQLWEAAGREAFEEGGVLGDVEKLPIGSFRHEKTLRAALRIKCSIVVYPMRVTEVLAEWPERSERGRAWFTIETACAAVHSKGLGRLLQLFASRHPATLKRRVSRQGL